MAHAIRLVGWLKHVITFLLCVQSSLGDSEKRYKALQDTVQQRGAAVPFLTPGNTSAQVAATWTVGFQPAFKL